MATKGDLCCCVNPTNWNILFDKVADACVSITAFDNDPNNINRVSNPGSGFLLNIKHKYYVVTAYSAIANINRQSQESAFFIRYNIYANISNINGEKKSRYYRLKLLAVDGQANLALLEIAHNGHNKNLPKLCDHKSAKLAKCNPKHGEAVAKIGYLDGYDHQSISSGIVREPNHLFYNFAANPNNYILCDMDNDSDGSPIFNCDGHIVGMATVLYNQNRVIGPNVRTIKRFVKSYLDCPGHFSKFQKEDSKPLQSSLGSFSRYLKGYMGITIDIFGRNNDLAKYLLPGMEWPDRNINGGVVTVVDPDGPWKKANLPGVDMQPVLLKINCVPIGDILCNEDAVGFKTWKLLPGDTVKIEYVLLKDFYTSSKLSTEAELILGDWSTIYDIPFTELV